MLSCNLPPAVLADDRDLLRATEAVPRGWTGYRNKTDSVHKVGHGGENSPAAPAGTRTRDLPITSLALKPLNYPRSPF